MYKLDIHFAFTTSYFKTFVTSRQNTAFFISDHNSATI